MEAKKQITEKHLYIFFISAAVISLAAYAYHLKNLSKAYKERLEILERGLPSTTK